MLNCIDHLNFTNGICEDCELQVDGYGCYSLDLYCNGKPCKDPRYFGGTQEFTAESGGDCRRQARKKGWKLNLSTNECFCPYCTGKKVAP